MTTKDAIDKLRESLKDENYYKAWQANIAMAVYDELIKIDGYKNEKIHDACNEGAKNFINLLMWEDNGE